MLIAAMTVEIFARALERCGVRCEVLGFTTRDWDGGEPAREWAAAKYPPHPGRMNALEHIIVKSADTPWRRARAGLGLFLHDEMLKENIDGEALLWAHERLMKRPETRRILVVVSDGTPMDEATAAANGFEYLGEHRGVQGQMLGVGLGPGDRQYHRMLLYSVEFVVREQLIALSNHHRVGFCWRREPAQIERFAVMFHLCQPPHRIAYLMTTHSAKPRGVIDIQPRPILHVLLVGRQP